MFFTFINDMCKPKVEKNNKLDNSDLNGRVGPNDFERRSKK